MWFTASNGHLDRARPVDLIVAPPTPSCRGHHLGRRPIALGGEGRHDAWHDMGSAEGRHLGQHRRIATNLTRVPMREMVLGTRALGAVRCDGDEALVTDLGHQWL